MWCMCATGWTGSAQSPPRMWMICQPGAKCSVFQLASLLAWLSGPLPRRPVQERSVQHEHVTNPPSNTVWLAAAHSINITFTLCSSQLLLKNKTPSVSLKCYSASNLTVSRREYRLFKIMRQLNRNNRQKHTVTNEAPPVLFGLSLPSWSQSGQCHPSMESLCVPSVSVWMCLGSTLAEVAQIPPNAVQSGVWSYLIVHLMFEKGKGPGYWVMACSGASSSRKIVTLLNAADFFLDRCLKK